MSTNLSDTAQRQDSPALKEQAQKLYLEGLGLRAIGRILRVHHKTLSRWLVQAAGQLPINQPKTKACSLIEVDELCSFVTKKIKMLDLDSDGFYFWQSAWLCLWQQIDQDG
ncbi:MAG: helix-turn-helix domain-containing protein [Deltaproteobacteria bacterium]|nr:helix-turn-helix domain-containing protein [Deltaproteobacteria bacterium]